MDYEFDVAVGEHFTIDEVTTVRVMDCVGHEITLEIKGPKRVVIIDVTIANEPDEQS